MGSSNAPLDLTLRDLERSCQGHSDFEGLYLLKGADLDHMLPLI